MIATENLKGRSGVYCAIHRDTLKCYVGSSYDLHGRRNAHLEAARGTKSQTCFHKALRELGINSFDFEVVELCPREKLSEREDFWIKFYQAASLKGFNVNPSATYFRTGKLPEATKARMREAHKSRPPISEETKLKTSLSCKGRVPGMLGKSHSEATKAKISAAHKGQIRGPHTEEHNRKIGLAGKGRKWSDETRAKLSLSFKSRGPMPQSQKDKIRATLAGRKPPQAAIDAARARKGYKMSSETKEKVRQAAIRLWEDRRNGKVAGLDGNFLKRTFV